jgi:hypothetical protein
MTDSAAFDQGCCQKFERQWQFTRMQARLCADPYIQLANNNAELILKASCWLCLQGFKCACTSELGPVNNDGCTMALTP